MPGTKIATCCYCGNRTALVLRGRDRHELSCASCGAPLHEMKMLRADHGGERTPVRPSPVRQVPHPVEPVPHHDPRRRMPKRRKGFGRRLLEEAFDLIEDILD